MLRKLIAIATLAVAVAAISGIGYAAIPGSNGVISACKDSKGSLKVIDAEAGQACGPNQQPLSWNQQGPPGPAGPPGISGYEIVYSQSANDSSELKEVWAQCPSGKAVLGGGGKAYYWTSSGEFLLTELALSYSGPAGPEAWGAWANETVATSQPWVLRAYAICANVS